MSASIVELILARVATCLAAAGLSVARGRADAFGEDELPALNVWREACSQEVVGQQGARLTVNWEIRHQVAVAADWETAIDALHMQVHAVLMADAPLAVLGRGLRCTSTEPQGDSAERVLGTLTARYQMQVFVRPGDFTRAIS